MFFQKLIRLPRFAKLIPHTQPQQAGGASPFGDTFGHRTSQPADHAVLLHADQQNGAFHCAQNGR